MYRIWNYLFGWDYVLWRNSADSGLARVRKSGDNKVWYWRYKITNVFDEVKSPEQVIWLTCHPCKYFALTGEELEIKKD